MKTQIIDCFDDVIQKRILKLNEKLDSISPDNINYIDSTIIEQVAIVNGKINNLNFMYSGDAMINSVDTFKLNSLVTKCKARIMRFSAQAILGVPATNGSLMPLREYLNSVKDNETQLKIQVPESFSGLRSFIICHENPEGKQFFAPGVKSKFWYSKEDGWITFHFNKYVLQEIYILYWK